MGTNMNSDLTPDRSDTRHGTSDAAAFRQHWRPASNAHDALFAAVSAQRPGSGEIWSIRDRAATPDQELLLAVITAVGEHAATVVPLSTELRRATEWDLIIPATALGYEAVAQAKLVGTVALDQLDQRLSSLMPESTRDLDMLVAVVGAETATPPEQLAVGPWVLSENDHRLRARVRVAEQLRAYLTPLYEDPLSEWQSLGAILARGSRASGIPLTTIIGNPGWAEKLQADELDPFAAVPPRKMAELVKTLRVGWTERVRDAVYRLASRYTPPEISYGTVLGRRQGKRAQRSRRVQPSQEQREQAASDYVAAVERALEDR